MGHLWRAFVSTEVNGSTATGETLLLGPTHWARGLQAPVAFPYQRPVEASLTSGGFWQDNFDGTFTQLDDNYCVPTTGWSYLDRYLMGMIAPSKVRDFFLLRNLVPTGSDANGRGIFKADRVKVSGQDVIAAEGLRPPQVDQAQKKFNNGMVMVVEHGEAPGCELLDRTKAIAERWIDYWVTVRGALHWLQREGYVMASGNGTQSRLIVAPLTKENSHELYSIIGHVEGLGARLTALPPAATCEKVVGVLKEINEGLGDLASARRLDPNRIFDLDISFHRHIVEASAGPRLLDLHGSTQPQAERYWRLYARAIFDEPGTSVEEHN